MANVAPTAEFKLSITKALADQLAAALDPLDPAPLTEHSLSRVQQRPGVYLLFVDRQKVYVGKAKTDLQERLHQHRRKLSGRARIHPDTITFVCVYVDEDLDAAAPETLLIKKYQATESLPWNNNGFGNKDPGRQRDTSLVKASHFDANYPINLDVKVELAPGHWRLDKLLEATKKTLPFNLRYDRSAKAKDAYMNTTIRVPAAMTVRELMPAIATSLPAGWQVTVLPGYLVVYKEDQDYASAIGWWRSTPNGDAPWNQGPSRFEQDGGTTQLNLDDDDLGDS